MSNIWNKPKIFFYCFPQGSPDQAAYQHSIICLAEGFKKIGIDFYADRNYWQLSTQENDYLFRHNPSVTADDCSVVIINDFWLRYGKALPSNLFHSRRKYITVYFELFGTSNYSLKPELKNVDFVFKAHSNSRLKYPINFYPWAFGLSNRILQATSELTSFGERKRNLLVNFRVNHPIRNIVQKKFIPGIKDYLQTDSSSENFNTHPTDDYDYLMWCQTGRRHYPNYYKRLLHSSACACFGGYFRRSFPQTLGVKPKFWHRILNKLDLSTPKITRWESWRFWEALAAGCVPFHLDYNKYGASLPVMPENWRHYVGVDLGNIQETINRIANEPQLLEKISTEGRRWAIEHYSPVPTAERFLKIISQ